MIRIVSIILLALVTLQAAPMIGYTSVNLLRLRYGTEGIALGECGTAFSSDLSSVFYNPANATFYGSRNEVMISASGGYESLLPSLKIDDLKRNDMEYSLFLPSLINDFSFAFLYSLHTHYFGSVPDYSIDGSLAANPGGSKERVSTFVISSSWRDWISVGISFKTFYSELSSWDDEAPSTRGVALDFGVRGQYRFTPGKRFYILPGCGFSITNVGGDVRYDEETTPDPIPTMIRTGFSLETGLTDIIWLASMIDTRKLIAKHEYIDDNEWEPVPSIGFQLGLTPLLQLNCGFLKNDIESVDEFHWGFTAGYRHKQFRSFLNAFSGRENSESRGNVQLLYSMSVIEPTGANEIREDQMSHQWSFSFAPKRRSK